MRPAPSWHEGPAANPLAWSRPAAERPKEATSLPTADRRQLVGVDEAQIPQCLRSVTRKIS
eukprot:2732583-Alexandrium_andersonii.AAC.1